MTTSRDYFGDTPTAVRRRFLLAVASSRPPIRAKNLVVPGLDRRSVQKRLERLRLAAGGRTVNDQQLIAFARLDLDRTAPPESHGLQVLSGLAAMGLERIAYRPLRGAPRLVPLISAIGASFFLQDFIRLIESLWRNTFYLTYPTLDLLEISVKLGMAVEVPLKSILVIATALMMLLGLHLFVNRTKVGTAIRAVAQDPDTASLMGIDVNRIITLTFFVGGAMGGVAGVLFGLHYSLVNPYTGFIPGLKAFTAAVLGGIGNIPGAVLGGIVLGLMEAFAASYLSILTNGAFGAEYKDVFAFAVLIFILTFRPKGLLGEKVREEGA